MFLTREGQGLNYLNFSPVCNTELTEITDHCLNSTAEIYFFIFFYLQSRCYCSVEMCHEDKEGCQIVPLHPEARRMGRFSENK